MKIVKGDTVYLRSGKDVAGISRLREAMNINKNDEAQFDAKRADLPMAEQIAKANARPGIRGKVIRVLPAEGKVVVEGRNLMTKHQKPRAQGAGQVQTGGRIEMPAAIPVSRVMLVCPHCDQPTRVGLQLRKDTRQTVTGSKTVTVRDRVCKQCKQVIDRPTDQTAR